MPHSDLQQPKNYCSGCPTSAWPPPQKVDYATDLFNMLSMDGPSANSTDLFNMLSRDFNLQMQQRKQLPQSQLNRQSQLKVSGIEDLFKDQPLVLEKPQKDVKNDIMSLFGKVGNIRLMHPSATYYYLPRTGFYKHASINGKINGCNFIKELRHQEARVVKIALCE
ncbi:putative ADP-ribosylation factor GTPase-activating protein AGD5 [Acorus calamus]|uniref:ADP-ribosylation factor GTPase-activating protein AGD5 n=1 Tax=Acorus calamus TaxID=4465 RepID=A0AAV9DTW6_ACOCL|nr:putative ADP-ribosylation factor GTPase-activating protein AGD5 [Acorus calamus]